MELFTIYKRCNEDTQNFTTVTGKMFFEHRKYIEIIRKICGLTNTDMERIYFQKYGSRFRSSNYELYPNFCLGKKVAGRIAEIFMEELPKVKDKNFERIALYDSRVYKNRESFTSGGALEDEVEKLLIKWGLPFEKHSRLVGVSGAYHKVDFVIGSRLNPKYVIEVKKSNLFKHGSMLVAKELAATAVDLKRRGLEFIVVLEVNWSDISLKFLRFYCNKVILKENLDELQEALRYEKGM